MLIKSQSEVRLHTGRSVHFHPSRFTRPSFSIFRGSGSETSTCCTVKQEAPKKQHEGRHAPLLLLRKQAHDKRGIAESLHAQITRARLTACEVGVFSREISQLSKIRPPPTFRSHLSLSPMGVFSKDYGNQ